MSKIRYLVLFISFNIHGTLLQGQDISNCNVIEWTVDDLYESGAINHIEAGFDFEPYLKQDCGCSSNTNNCVLIKLKMLRNVNNSWIEQSCERIRFIAGWFPGNVSNQDMDVADFYNPISCNEYPPKGGTNSNPDDGYYDFNTSNLGGGTLELLMCKGSDSGRTFGLFDNKYYCESLNVVHNGNVTPTDSEKYYENHFHSDFNECYGGIIDLETKTSNCTHSGFEQPQGDEMHFIGMFKAKTYCKCSPSHVPSNLYRIYKPIEKTCYKVTLLPTVFGLGNAGNLDKNYKVSLQNNCQEINEEINGNIKSFTFDIDTEYLDVYVSDLDTEFGTYFDIQWEPCNDCKEELIIENHHQNSNIYTSNSLFPDQKIHLTRYSDVTIDQNGNVFTLAAVMEAPDRSELQVFKNGGAYQVYIGDTDHVQGTEIKVDNDGFVYVAGSFRGPSPFVKNGSIYHTLDSQCDGIDDCVHSFVIKFNPDFTQVVWDLVLKSPNYVYVEDVTLIGSNSFALAGRAIGKTNFDPHFTNQENTSPNTEKAFVAKYTISPNKPKLDWVRTLYANSPHYTRVNGFGLTSDPTGNIYMCGAWRKINDNHSGVAVDGGTVQNWPAPNHDQGFVVSYGSTGDLLGAVNIAKNGYLKDIEYHNGKLYGVGLKMEAIINISNGVPTLQSASEVNHYYEEIVGSNESCKGGSLYTTGWFGMDPTLKIMDNNMNVVHQIVQAGPTADFAAGLTVDVSGKNVVMGSAFSKPSLQLLSPHDTNPQVQKSSTGQADYVTTKFKCDCIDP